MSETKNTPIAELIVEEGSAYVFYAFDVASSIDIDKATRLISLDKKKIPVHDKKRAAKYFEFTPQPIRLTMDTLSFSVGEKFSTTVVMEVLVFDFGCISVRFQIPLKGPINDIIDLSMELYENQGLKREAKEAVLQLISDIHGALDRPELAERIEDYCAFHFAKLNPAVMSQQLLSEYLRPITNLLRAETAPPSEREMQEILNDRISYGLSDVTLMSWYSAVIYGEHAEDIYTVLEFANLVLMELSHLDARLDKSLDEFYDYFTEQQGQSLRFFDLRSKKSQLRRISRFQIDSAVSFERINNALKLLGDDFQARVFQMASKKMGLTLWEASVSRKLRAIESIYDKISDSEATRRLEVLEWIIIILIAVSILIPFIPGMK